MTIEDLKAEDMALYQCLKAEETRHYTELEMIASESIQPQMALLLAGSAFNNKTAVGSIGKQRLQGSEYADTLERLAAARVCEIFGAEHANVTTYSGTVANFCAYESVLKPYDSVVTLAPDVGAHQSHGGNGNISSKLYQFHYFGIKRGTSEIDYEEAERMAADVTPNPFPHADIVTASTTKTMCGPHSGFIMCKKEYAEQIEASIYPGHVASLHLQTIAAMTYTLKRSQTKEFKQMMQQVVRNAQWLCDALLQRGFQIFTGGTDCHMFLLDLKPYGIDGVNFSEALNRAGITVNSKRIPYENTDLPGGIRAGTTVLTQRGMKEEQMEEVADLFYILAKDKCSDVAVDKVRKRVITLTEAFPLPR